MTLASCLRMSVQKPAAGGASGGNSGRAGSSGKAKQGGGGGGFGGRVWALFGNDRSNIVRFVLALMVSIDLISQSNVWLVVVA